jgi:hypothetical protein
MTEIGIVAMNEGFGGAVPGKDVVARKTTCRVTGQAEPSTEPRLTYSAYSSRLHVYSTAANKSLTTLMPFTNPGQD